MFWTMVGALLFVFVVIPFGIRILGLGLYSLTFKSTWRVICSVIGFILVLSMWANSPDDGTNWVMLGFMALGVYMFFLGIIGSFSFDEWRKFWSESENVDLIPPWFDGNKEAWNEFYKWTETFIEKIQIGLKEEYLPEFLAVVPEWFEDENDMKLWNQFGNWNYNFIQNHLNGSLPNENKDAYKKAPPWFNGNKKYWSEYVLWYKKLLKNKKM